LLDGRGQRADAAWPAVDQDRDRRGRPRPGVGGGAWAGPPARLRNLPARAGRYVRDQRALGLEDAVRKMTSAVAERLGLRERGLLRVGCYADVAVFDPATIADQATFEAPHQLSQGVRDVWVNGVRVLQDGAHTGATPGCVVARS